MRFIQRSVRLSLPLDRVLRALAKRHDVSTYAMLQRSVKVGVSTLANPPAPHTFDHEVIAELASISTRMADAQRVLDRNLYVACAAYCYARNAASGVRKGDEIITAEINAAFERQHRLAQEVRL